jgi:flagellar capping protein FliD
MTVSICTDNEKIDEDIKLFQQALSNDDELIGERLSTLARLLREMGY